MSMDDLFNSSFFITITLTAIMIALLFTFFTNKLNEQNHKLETMVDIIQSLTAEIQFIRSSPNLNLSHSIPTQKNNIESSSKQFSNKMFSTNTSNLINVSEHSSEEDDNDEDEDEDDDEDEDEDEDEDNDDDDDDDEDDEDEEDDDNDDDDEGKVFEKHVSNNADDDKAKYEEEDINIKNITNLIIQELTEGSLENNNIKSIINEDLQQDSYLGNKNDLKKKRINELKEILKKKNPTLDISKLKKEEIIDILILSK